MLNVKGWVKMSGAQKEEYARVKKNKRDFVTFALDYVKHPVAHGPWIDEEIKTQKNKESVNWEASGYNDLHTA